MESIITSAKQEAMPSVPIDSAVPLDVIEEILVGRLTGTGTGTGISAPGMFNLQRQQTLDPFVSQTPPLRCRPRYALLFEMV